MIGLGGRHADSQGQSSSLDTEEGRRFDSTLFSAIEALEEGQVHYVIIGGVAASGLGRPRPTQDIDIFVRPEDAEAVLDVLKSHGFRVEKTDPSWLFKAFKDDVLVDVIFRSQGGIYFDDEMRDRAVKVNYHHRQIRLVSPEDFIIIKCAVHSEEGPHHWHDALSVLSHAKIDWDYLLHRSRKAPRRLLALLIYAQSNDIWIPNQMIQKLHHTIFGDLKPITPEFPLRLVDSKNEPRPSRKDSGPDAYLAGKIHDALISDENVGAQDIEVLVQGNQVLARGQCQSKDQYEAILRLIRNLAPDHLLSDQLQVAEWEGPTEREDFA
jgi:predicted nucleotidyltransferase